MEENEGAGDNQQIDFMALLQETMDSLRNSSTEREAAALADLEVVYGCIEERENDFKVAAQIGQMLVQRNQDLMDEIEGMKRDWEAEVNVQRVANNGLLSTLEQLEEENGQLVELNEKSQVLISELKMKCELLQREGSVSRDLQNKAMEDNAALKNQIRSLKLQAKLNAAYKDRVRVLSEEIESLKTVLMESQEKNSSLQKMNTILIQDQVRLKEAAGKDEVLEYEVKSLKDKVEELKKHKEVNKNLKAELVKQNEAKQQLEKSAEDIANLSEVVASLMKANKFFQQKQSEDQDLLAEANNTIANLRAQIEQQELEFSRFKENMKQSSLSEEISETKKQDKELKQQKGEEEKRIETERQMRKQIRIEMEEELRTQLRKELKVEIEQGVEVKLLAEFEKGKEAERKENMQREEKVKEAERKEKEERERKAQEEVKKEVVDEGKRGEDIISVESEEEKKKKEEDIVQALKASLSQDIFKLVYAELTATPSLPPIEEPVALDLRNRVTQRLEEQMGIKSIAEKFKYRDEGSISSPSMESSDEEFRPRKRSQSQISREFPPADLTAIPSATPIKRSPPTASVAPASSAQVNSPESMSPMAIFNKIANMENYLVSPRPKRAIEKKWRRNSVAPGMLRRLAEEEKEREAQKAKAEAEEQERQKEREREAKFSTLPSRFSEEQAELMQQLREALKNEGAETQSPRTEELQLEEGGKEKQEESTNVGKETVTQDVDKPSEGLDQATSGMRGVGEENSEKEKEERETTSQSKALKELQEHEREESVEDLVSEEMIELRNNARIKLAAARRLSESEGDEGGVKHKESPRVGRTEWIRKSSPAVNRKTNPHDNNNTDSQTDARVSPTRMMHEESYSTGDAKRELLVAALESGSRDSIPLQLRELALGLEEIGSSYSSSDEQDSYASDASDSEFMRTPRRKRPLKKRASTFNIKKARQHLIKIEEEMKKSQEEQEKQKREEEEKKAKEELERQQKEKKGKEKESEHESREGKMDEASREKAIIQELYGNLRLDAIESEESEDEEATRIKRKEEEGIMIPLSKLRDLEREERYYIKALCALRNKLDDANLKIMNKAMKDVLSFYELIQLSDALITSVSNEARDLLKTEGMRNPSLPCLAIDLLLEICLLMHRCNDFSVGINQPTIEKLEAFKKQFSAKENAPPTTPVKQPPKPKGGFLSSIFG